jgi:anti-sigma-K factor RskA
MKNPARKTFEPLLSPYVDGELSPEERQAVERHIAADKDSAAQVADFRAASGLTRLSFEMLADEQDFSDFANQVMARVTPAKLPLLERMKLSMSEMFTYQRGTFVTAGALAFALLAVAGTALQMSTRDTTGYSNPAVEVQTVSVDTGSSVRPVVFETEKGDAIIWMVDDAHAKPPEVKKTDAKHEELELEPGQEGAPKKAGEL